MKNIEEVEKIENKMSLFQDTDTLLKYVETVKDFLDLFVTLDDKDKFEVIQMDFFKKQGDTLKRQAIKSIEDSKIKYELLKNGSIKGIIDDDFFNKELIRDLPEDLKLDIIKDGLSTNALGISSFNLRQVINEMTPESIEVLLQAPETMKEIGISSYDIPGFISRIPDDKKKEEIMSKYDLKRWEKMDVITSFSSEYKIGLLTENTEYSNEEIIKIINSLKTEEKIAYMKDNKAFMDGEGIRVFDIVRTMGKDGQLEFIKYMSELELEPKETRLIIAGLSNETKDELDPNLVEETNRDLLGLRLEDGKSVLYKINKIVPDISLDLTIYKDLDELLYVNPLELDDDGRKKVVELLEICPDLKIHDNIDLESSTAKEYIEAEEWIDSLLGNIDPDWTDIQKMAFIDTEIGKRISYSPDFDTEIEDAGAQRALWKIISSGYGVCNGISQVEKYILSKVGIESEIIGSGTHAFLKVNNIEIPTKDGIKKGDTLLDPTWNLGSSRYGGKPAHFCNSYEEIRKADIGSDGRDHACHKSEKLEKIDLINMDEESLREVYKSIGIADEEGKFPISKMLDEKELIDKTSKDVRENISKKIELLRETCPEYAACINSTDRILSSILFEQSDNFSFNRCIVSRVYDKSDENKTPVLYTYLDFEEEGKLFFYADKETGEFVELSKEEFEKRFDCYERDKEKTDGKRAWEYEKEVDQDLSRTSGEIEASDKKMNQKEDDEYELI